MYPFCIYRFLLSFSNVDKTKKMKHNRGLFVLDSRLKTRK